jgi:serine/threonine-protein kinase
MSPGTTHIDLERMDRDRLARLTRILDEALDLPREEAAAVLERHCGADAELRAQAEALLAADAAAGSFLERPAAEYVPGLLESDAEEASPLEGARVGPWRLVRELGRGGMGRVFLAERADGAFEQQVAVKLLKRGLDTDEILARFVQERQILARLAHPGVARLLDGGVTADGLPWFALEHVEGVPITEHVDGRGLDLRAVLALFARACRAVEFAHRSLVVHRDLKPANILVTEGGEVKLLDFGIAKLLGEADVGAARTGAALRLLTPQYAAPEQVRGEPPTTATDVYSLGVVLYELLTGERPYRRKTGSLEETKTAVLEQVPEAPGARLRRAAPGSRRAAWARQVRGDLDNIVLQAVRKEPEARYASAEALAEDLERWLAGEPVRATERRAAYVARKFVGRHRAAMATACAVLLALVAGLFATAWQARVAERERDRARLEARKAGEIRDFVLGLFRVADPLESRGESVTARELLDRGAERVERELRDQPAVQAGMWDLLSSVYRNLGLYPRAVGMAERSLAVHRAQGLGETPEVALSLHALGSVLIEAGEYALADSLLREAVALRGRLHGPRSREVAMSLGELAVVSGRLGRTAEAESLYRAAIGIDSVTVGMDHSDTATDVGNLGMLLYYDSRYAEALPYLDRQLAIRERVFGRDHPETAVSIGNLGNCLTALSELDRAVALQREALAIRRRWYGPEHPDVAHSMHNLAGTLERQGSYAEAESLYRGSLAIRHGALDPGDPLLGQSHNDLATCLYREGRYDSSAVHFREAELTWSRSLPPGHRNILAARHNLGVVLRELGRYGESEAILRDVLEKRIAMLGTEHFDVSLSWFQLGRLLAQRGERAEAGPLLRCAVALRTELLGADHPRTAEAQEALASLLRDEGRVAESLALYDSALATVRAKLPEDNPQVADVLVGKGRLLVEEGRAAEAESLLAEGLAIRERKLPATDRRVEEARTALARCRARP